MPRLQALNTNRGRLRAGHHGGCSAGRRALRCGILVLVQTLQHTPSLHLHHLVFMIFNLHDNPQAQALFFYSPRCSEMKTLAQVTWIVR